MRMYLVNPKFMCDKHLVREHDACHVFSGSVTKAHHRRDTGTFESAQIKPCHDAVVEEMERRGIVHGSPLIYFDNDRNLGVVDREKSLVDLLQCPDCKAQYEIFKE